MRRFLLLSMVLLALPLVAPGAARSATVTWTATAEACGGASAAERGSGQLDASGNLYVPCSQDPAATTSVACPYAANTRYGQPMNHIAIINGTGTKTKLIPLDFDRNCVSSRAADVAPSPDGSFLYAIRYSDGAVYRFDRQADGSYRAQEDWELATFPEQGETIPINEARGQFLATDANGDIYMSAGLWTGRNGIPSTDVAIVKYHADGTYVTRFGRHNDQTWALGNARGSFGGVAVTADGKRVFVADINNSRIQRFDRGADGTYTPVLEMGNPSRSLDGSCFSSGELAAPYDVSLSTGGEVVVINTTCYAEAGDGSGLPTATVDVQRFAQDGASRGNILVRVQGDNRVHGIAMDAGNGIHLVTGLVAMRPQGGWTDAGAAAGGMGPMGGTGGYSPDVTAPTVSLTAPATTTTRVVTLTIAAADDRGVTQMRIATDGVWGAWQNAAATYSHTLADRYGAHAVSVQVRDAAGNESAQANATINRPAPVDPDPVDPPHPPIGGGGGGDTVKPAIRMVRMPAQLSGGRSLLTVYVTASDNVGATQVRFSTGTGTWGVWQPIAGRHVLRMRGLAGWRGVFIQVQDAAGNRSTPWFQTVLVAPLRSAWRRGGSAADTLRAGVGSQFIDVSQFDGDVDHVSCGAGIDAVFAQPDDVVAADCERVTRVKMPAW